MILSYSRAHCFEECPAKFKAEYIDHKRGPAEPYLVLGSAVHAVADHYTKHLKETSQPSELEHLRLLTGLEWAERTESGEISVAYRDEFFELCRAVGEWVMFTDPADIIGSEVRVALDRDFHVVDWSDRDAFVRGVIDLLRWQGVDDDEGHQRSLVLQDYKSGHRVENPAESMQLKTYFVMAQAFMGQYPNRGVLLYLRNGIPRACDFKDPEAIEKQVRQYYQDTDRAIDRCEEMERWPAKPGLACRGCGIFGECPARTRFNKTTPPNSEEDAVAMLERLVLIERERSESREMLGAWVEQYGALEANGVTLAYQPERHLAFDTAKVWTLLESRGFRPLDSMKVDSRAIKKLARKDRRLQADIEATATDASITKLKLSTTEDE